MTCGGYELRRAREGALALGAAATLGLSLILAGSAPAAAQHAHGHSDEHHGQGSETELHFSHPLVAECINPASMLAVGHGSYTLNGAAPQHRAQIEGELALSRTLSIQLHTQLDYHGTFQDLEVGLKGATFSFEDSGLLLGYGVALSVPVAGLGDEDVHLAAGQYGPADGHGREAGGLEPLHDHAPWELVPSLNFGVRQGPWELIAWTSASVDPGTLSPEFGYRVTGAWGALPALTALLELDGPAGHGPDGDAVTVAPGALVRLPDRPLVLGFSAGVPLTHRDRFGPRAQARLLWHF